MSPGLEESVDVLANLELESAAAVPDTHLWVDRDEHPSVDATGVDAVPTVDLGAADAAARVRRACEEWGVFQLTGHGVPAPLLARLDAQIRRLFALPLSHKLRTARQPGSISGYGLAPISSFFSKRMWSEGFTLTPPPLEHARRLFPDDYADFCHVMEEYEKAMKEVVRQLLELMLISLFHAEDNVKWAAGQFRDVSAALQLNWYPSCPNPERVMGMAAHTDSGLLTVLYQSTAGPSGLQVLRAGPPRWVTVTPVAGALVVNVGDLAHILSDGRFRSVVHRAVVDRSRGRLSAAYISGPPADVKVGAPSYRAVTWPEYRGLKAKLFDKALASIKVSEEDRSNNSVISCG